MTKRKKFPFELKSRERIITAYAETACGSGWVNSPIWVIIGQPDGKYRLECIQPEQRTLEMTALYSASNVIHRCMVAAVQNVLDKNKE